MHHKPARTLQERHKECPRLPPQLVTLGGAPCARFLDMGDLERVQLLLDEAAEGGGLVPPVDQRLADLVAGGLLCLCVCVRM